jgi:hypothetical protein
MVGGVPLTSPTAENMQLFILLWGDSGSGKTTLAATAPGTKLFVMFDPGGDLSLADRSDIAVLSLGTQSPATLLSKFGSPDPYDIGNLLRSRPDIETVVIDSMTSFAYMALQNAIMRAGGAKISIEQPGMQGYTYRNASVLKATNAIMRLCMEHKRHLILTTHEGTADRTDTGVITSVTMALSEGTANAVGLRFNEIWHLSDTGTERRIAVRPCRLRRPMKTRLFDATQPEFVWHYNANTLVGEGIADWYHAWQEGKGKKLPLPSRASATTSRGGSKK